MKHTFTLLTSLLLAGSIRAEIPYPAALDAAAVVQSPMAAEIPGSLILGNGDLNGILWFHGRLRFSITKNDICDGRLETAKDPDLVRIDVSKHEWLSPSSYYYPISWCKPYPCPLIAGHVEIARTTGWSNVRWHQNADVRYDASGQHVIATISGKAKANAGWGFTANAAGRKVVAKLSGSSNAKWYLDFPGTGLNSGWQAASSEPREVTFEIPKNTKLGRIDLYIWTNDGKPSEIRLHSVHVDGVAQPLAGAGTTGVDSRLDLARAVATVPGKLTARVLANHNAFVFETAEPVTLTPCSASFIPPSTRGAQDGVEWVLTKVPGDEDWGGMSFALAHAANGTRHVVTVVSSLEAKEPAAAAMKLARELIAEDAAKQVAEHERVWREFWKASGVDLAGDYLESFWYRNLYFLRSFSKPGVPPVGLFMGCALNEMPWHGVATTDYNFEQAFWGGFICNHAELVEPYNRYMVDYLPRGKWFAKETYGLDGAFYPVNHFTHQIFDPMICKSKNRHMNFYMPWTYVPGANGWQAHNVWLAYQHHPDRQYLKDSAYPLVKEMAIFYADFLEKCRKTPEGKAVYGPSHSPEHHSFGVDDTPCDIAWTRFTFKAAIHGATILGCDADLVKRWQAALALVPDYPRSTKQQPPVIVDIRGGEPIRYNITVPLLPVFPVGEVNWWSPEEEKEIFARTAQTINSSGYNCSIMLAGARIRLSMPDSYEWTTARFKERQMPNGFLKLLKYGPNGVNNDPRGNYHDTRGNYSEQTAAAGIVSEMLMQSIGDIIRVFPAWPKDKDAKFTNLSAQGGFLVSAEQKAGKVTRLEITSKVGGKLRFLNPWTGKIVERDTKPGEKLKMTP
jgi:hypothetical protein